MYSNLEDKWYSFLDSLDAKGIPVYKMIDPIEKAGIPSFPLFIGIVLLIVFGAIYISMPGGAGGISGIKLTVYTVDQNGMTLEGANVKLLDSNMNLIGTAKTGPEGKAVLSVPSKLAGKDLLLQGSKENCQFSSKTLNTKTSETVKLLAQCAMAPNVTGCFGLGTTLTTVSLADSDGYPPSNCQVLVQNSDDPTDTIPVDWTVDGEGNLALDAPSTCPPAGSNYQVVIDCANMKFSASWDDFINDAKLGSITMTDKAPRHVIPKGDPDNYIHVTVHVTSEDGTGLDGILVTAVDEDNTPLVPSVSGPVFSGTTDALGNINLVFPEGTQFYLSIEDPNGAYFSKVVGEGDNPFTATSSLAFSPIEITLSRGYTTTIAVKEENTQTPIQGAIITVKHDGKVVALEQSTDAHGIATFTLLKNQTYDVEVRHPRYGTKTGTVTGGGNVTIWMSEVDLSKVGNLDIKVINAHGMQEPLMNVRIKLVKNNTTVAEQMTNDAGLIHFSNIEEGTYTIRAIPPGSVSYQTFTGIEVQAGNTTQKTLQVIPAQIHLTVLPLICIHPDKCVPKENVHIELWNSWLEEKINETDTGTTRKAEFTVDYGTPYFISATWTDPDTGKKFGPVVYSPSTPAYQDKTITFDVKEMTNDTKVFFGIDRLQPNATEVSAGSELKGWVSVSIPSNAHGLQVKEVDIELFTGEPGSITSVSQTPILIEPISLTDISVQDPEVVSLTKADEYYYGKEPNPEDTGMSKYIKIVLGKHKENNWYTATIPMHVRKGASGTAKINYRATWITTDGRKIQSNEGLWTSFTLKITPGQSTGSSLETGPFYQYSAYLTTTKNGKPNNEVTVTNGSYVYAHFRAIARLDTDNWVVDFKTIPEILQPIAFEGWIERAGGNKTYITQQNIAGWQITNTEGLYALKRDDVLNGVITLKAIRSGSASLVLFKDVNHPLGIKVSEIPAMEKDTVVAGVTGKLDAGWHVGGLQGSINPKTDVLPTDNKYFWLKLTLENQGNGTRHVHVLVKALDDSIKFDSSGTYIYDGNTTIDPGNESVMDITGYGQSDALNKMQIYIYEEGTPEPSAPWYELMYGPVNYKIVYRGQINGTPQDFLTEGTTEVDVRVVRDTAGTKESLTKLVSVRVDGEAGTITDEGYFKAMFTHGLGSVMQNGKVDIKADSDYFGELVESADVAYLLREPEYPGALKFLNVPLNGQKTDYLNITNYYPLPVKIKIGDVSAIGWTIDVKPSIYEANGSQWNKVNNTNVGEEINLLPKQKLVIEVTAKAEDIVCRNEQEPILNIETDQSGNMGYGLILKCSAQNVSVPVTTIPGNNIHHIAREPTSPERINELSCAYLNDSADNVSIAYLCDAEQLAVAIAKAADDLLNDPEHYEANYTYAFGNDELGQAGFDEAIHNSGAKFSKVRDAFETRKQAELSSGSDIVFNNIIRCGKVTVHLEKINMDKDVLVNVTEDKSVNDWCNRTGGKAYLVGLMNYDRDIRPLFGKYFSFDQAGDNADIFNAISSASEAGNDVRGSALFGYDIDGKDPNDIVSTITGGQAQSFVKWKVCKIGESLGCPAFAVNYLRNNDLGVVGYMRVNEYNDVYLGLVYDPTKVPETNIDRYKAAVVTRLMDWAINGTDLKTANPLNTSVMWVYLPDKDNLTNIIDLNGPKISQVLVMWKSLTGPTTEFAGSQNVTVKVTVTNDTQYCVLANALPDGSFVGPGGEGGPKAIENESPESGNGNNVTYAYEWTLTPGIGIKKVAVYCVDKDRVASNIGYGTIKLDTSGIDLASRLPSTVIMFKEFKDNALNFKVMSRYTNVTACWLEWPKNMPEDLQLGPTDGELGDCTSDINRDTNIGDGCCTVTPTTVYSNLLPFNYANVTCNSPTLTGEGTANTYLPVKVVCKNAAGVVKTLGEVNFYKYGAGAPVIFLPQTQFAMGWFKWNKNTETIALDQPMIEGTSFYCNISDSTCKTPSS